MNDNPRAKATELAAVLAEHVYDHESRRCLCGDSFHPDYVRLHDAEVALTAAAGEAKVSACGICGSRDRDAHAAACPPGYDDLGPVDDDEPGYDLVMPFVAVASKGGPYDDAAYVAGYEMGKLDERLGSYVCQYHEATIHSENLPQADLLAMRHRFTLLVISEDGDWTTVSFTLNEDGAR